jgi:hypothetical protein
MCHFPASSPSFLPTCPASRFRTCPVPTFEDSPLDSTHTHTLGTFKCWPALVTNTAVLTSLHPITLLCRYLFSKTNPYRDLERVSQASNYRRESTPWSSTQETLLNSLAPAIVPTRSGFNAVSTHAFEVEMASISLAKAMGGPRDADSDWALTTVFTARSLYCRRCGQSTAQSTRFCTACGEIDP